MGGNWKRIPATVLSFILISAISVNAQAEDQPKFYYSSQADISNSSQFMFSIDDVINPGEVLDGLNEGSSYYFISDSSLSVPDGFDFCFADGMVKDEAEYEETLSFLETEATVVGRRNFDKTAPSVPDGFYAWQVVIIVCDYGIESTKYFCVPYNPTNELTVDYDAASYIPLLAAIEETVENGEQRTIEWNEGDGLPSFIVKELIANPDINVHFRYSYQGIAYDLYLNGENLSKVYKDGIEWYGPLCLAACNGLYTGTNGWYVVKGDSSESVFGLDLIYPGQKIYY